MIKRLKNKLSMYSTVRTYADLKNNRIRISKFMTFIFLQIFAEKLNQNLYSVIICGKNFCRVQSKDLLYTIIYFFLSEFLLCLYQPAPAGNCSFIFVLPLIKPRMLFVRGFLFQAGSCRLKQIKNKPHLHALMPLSQASRFEKLPKSYFCASII